MRQVLLDIRTEHIAAGRTPLRLLGDKIFRTSDTVVGMYAERDGFRSAAQIESNYLRGVVNACVEWSFANLKNFYELILNKNNHEMLVSPVLAMIKIMALLNTRRAPLSSSTSFFSSCCRWMTKDQ